MKFGELSNRIIGAAIDVHRELGPGLLENVYKHCLAYELANNGIRCLCEVTLPVFYKGIQIDCGYRMDMVVEDTIILELKCVEKLLPIHQAQLITYMKLSGKKTGILINFNENYLKDGLKRLVLNL